MNERPIVILSSASPDKKEEYRRIFAKMSVDADFMTIEELGLSPRKTEEKTGEYEGNVVPKVRATVDVLMEARNGKLENVSKAAVEILGSRKVIAMVEDSGIEFFPSKTDLHLSDEEFQKFKEKFIENYHKIVKEEASSYYGFDEEGKLYSKSHRDSISWMFRNEKEVPGPDLKTHLEVLQGGFRKMFEVVHEALKITIGDEKFNQLIAEGKSGITYKNHGAAVFFDIDGNLDELNERQIIYGEDEGSLMTQEEFLETTTKPNDYGVFIGSVILPYSKDGRPQEKSRRDLYLSGKIFDGEILDYRMALVEEFKESVVETQAQTRDANSARAIKITAISNAKQKLPEVSNVAFAEVAQYDHKKSLQDPNRMMMPDCDIAVAFPSGNEIENLRLLLGLTVDKQTMPHAKNTKIAVFNQDGEFDLALQTLDHLRKMGLKQGYSEVDLVVRSPDEDFKELDSLIAETLKLKQVSLEILPSKDQKAASAADEITANHKTGRLKIFIAGGAANRNQEYEFLANQLARKIYQRKDCDLLTGAGQIEGPMGAAYNGFVESWLEEQMKNEKFSFDLKVIVAREIQENKNPEVAEKLTKLNRSIYKNERLSFFDFEVLSPPILDKIFGPLKEEKRLFGYGLEPLLTSEGGGFIPAGMIFEDSGNYTRRMNSLMKDSDFAFYLTGGQGTIQELIENVILLAEGKVNPKQTIIIINQYVDLIGKTYPDDLINFLQAYLKSNGKENQLQICNSLEEANQIMDSAIIRNQEEETFGFGSEVGEDKEVFGFDSNSYYSQYRSGNLDEVIADINQNFDAYLADFEAGKFAEIGKRLSEKLQNENPSFDNSAFFDIQQVDLSLLKKEDLVPAFFTFITAWLSQENLDKNRNRKNLTFDNIEGGPFAALIVRNNADGKPQIVGMGANHVATDKDPSAHGEMSAIRDATQRQGYSDLSKTTMYTSSECCPQCLKACLAVGIDNVYFSNKRVLAAAIGFADDEQYDLMTKVDHVCHKAQGDAEVGELERLLNGHQAVIVDDKDKVIAYGDAKLESQDPLDNLPSMVAIRMACKNIGDFSLPAGCRLITKEKPILSLTTADWAGIGRVEKSAAFPLGKNPLKICYLDENPEKVSLINERGETSFVDPLEILQKVVLAQQGESTYSVPVNRDAAVTTPAAFNRFAAICGMDDRAMYDATKGLKNEPQKEEQEVFGFGEETPPTISASPEAVHFVSGNLAGVNTSAAYLGTQ